MASIDKFNDHCWMDVVPEGDLKLYSRWRRETFVGARPALLAIDLYDLVYRGGPLPPVEIDDRYPNACGVFAHRAVAPTKKLIAAARRAGIPIFFCTQETRPNNRPAGAVSTRRSGGQPSADAYAIYREFAVEPEDIVICKQRASIFQGTPLSSHLPLLGVQSLNRVRREHVRLRARERRRQLFERISRHRGRGMHLRSRRTDAQGQPFRHAPQIRRRDAHRRSVGAS